MITNTYPLFLKLITNLNIDEELSLSIYNQLNKTYSVNAFEQSSKVVKGYFLKDINNNSIHLLNKISYIYNNGEKRLFSVDEQNNTRIEEVIFKRYIYSFLIGKSKNEDVCILTNFYKEECRIGQHLILTGNIENPFIKNNKYNWISYTHNNIENIIINTFNAFINYGKCLNYNRTIKMNTIFFSDIINDMKGQQHKFQYLKYSNCIVVYQYN